MNTTGSTKTLQGSELQIFLCFLCVFIRFHRFFWPVTEKYILNILETYVHKFGSDKIELLYLDGTTDGDVVFVHYHDKHDSSNVNGEYFKVKSKESFEALDKMCKENGFDFEY